MEKFDSIKQQLDKDLADESKPWTKYLKLAEEKTGVSRSYIFLGEFAKSLKASGFIIGAIDGLTANTNAKLLWTARAGERAAQGYQGFFFFRCCITN